MSTAPNSTPAAAAVPAELRMLAADRHTAVVSAEGDLDLASAPALKWMIVDAFKNGHDRVVIDLAGVTFIDSTTLSVLLGITRNLREGQRVVLAGVGDVTRGVLRLTGVERAFELYPTVDAALASFACPGEEAEESRSGPPLDRTAGLVLGLATTAMPFAGSVDEQAERWLRLLRSYGTASLLLAALGITEHPPAPDPVPGDGSRGRPDEMAAEVADEARREASVREARTVNTTDVLSAVLTVYGDSFERALRRHGCEGWQLRELLELERADA